MERHCPDVTLQPASERRTDHTACHAGAHASVRCADRKTSITLAPGISRTTCALPDAELRAWLHRRATASLAPSTPQPAAFPLLSCRVLSAPACRGARRWAEGVDADRPG